MFVLEDKQLTKNKKIKKNHNVLKQQEAINKSPQWSDLNVDLLDEIAGRLCFVDQVCFHSVCKTWYSHKVQYKTRSVGLMPWVVRLWRSSIHMFECQIFAAEEPLECNFKPIAVQKLYLDQFVTSYPLCFDTDIDITCRYGWILFNLPTRDYTATTFLFYCPLTKKIVVLPLLPHSRGSNYEFTTCFSAAPDSPDFVFLVIKHFDTYNTITTYCHGAWSSPGVWSRLQCLCLGRGCIAVCIRELFLFVDAYGRLASYNISNRRCKWECVSRDNAVYTSRKRYAFESNGELMLGYHTDKFGRCVSRFDWYEKRWVSLNNLSDRALFVSLNSFSVSSVGEEETNNVVVANKIYVLHNLHCSVDSLDDVWIVHPGFNICGKDMKNIHNELTCWIEPPGNLVNRKQPGVRTVQELGKQELGLSRGRLYKLISRAYKLKNILYF